MPPAAAKHPKEKNVCRRQCVGGCVCFFDICARACTRFVEEGGGEEGERRGRKRKLQIKGGGGVLALALTRARTVLVRARPRVVHTAANTHKKGVRGCVRVHMYIKRIELYFWPRERETFAMTLGCFFVVQDSGARGGLCRAHRRERERKWCCV